MGHDRWSRVRILIAAFAIAGVSLLVRPGTAAAQAGERIRSYRIDLQVESSGDLLVTERIDYDFAGFERHGIYRDVPVRFTYDGRYDRVLPVDVRSVQATGGAPDDFEVKTEGPLLRIRIGDPDQTITGRHVYTIVYVVRGSLNGFSDHDELYWNAVGQYWGVPIENVSVRARLPGEVLRVACFAGPPESRLSCDRGEHRGSTATFTQAALGPGEALTVVIGFPTGAVVPAPAPLLEERWSMQRAFSVTPVTLGLTALLLLALGLGIGRLLWVTGRDRRIVGSAVDVAFASDGEDQRVPLFESGRLPVQYAPPDGMRPGQVGTLVDEVANPLDVTATIVDLAVRGYLRIEEIPKRWLFGKPDWWMTKLKDADEDLLSYERLLLDGLFEDTTDASPADGRPTVKLSNLKRKFSDRLRKVQDALYDDAVKRKWFAGRPDKVRDRWQTRGWIAAVAGGGLIWLLAAKTHFGLLAIPVALAGLVLVFAAKRMPRRSPKGTGMVRQIMGFRTYIATAEVEESRFAERANLFSQYLPFAIVFGLTEKWAKAFADLEGNMPQTDWYTGSRAFNVHSFSSTMDGFSVTTAGTISSTPASSGSSGFGGGGSSGGGGGGGGGGSW